jgi:glucokinase
VTLILALDFGGTKLAGGVVNVGSRQWLRYERCFSPTNANASSDLEMMRSLIHSLLQSEKPAAIGVSFGGPVDATTGTVRLSHHVSGWENIRLKDLLEAEFGVFVSVDNDANVAALGEHRFGAGQGYESMFYITVSTGVGGGWILNNQPWRGAGGMAGEIGHMIVDPAGPMCLCGKRGCVERLASGVYMARDVREMLENEPQRSSGKSERRFPPFPEGVAVGEASPTGEGIRAFQERERREGEILRDLVGGNLELVTGKVVSEAAGLGDELAKEILYRGAWGLGVGIGNVANLMNPQRFVLGGSVTKAGERWWEVVRKTARETALPEVDLEIVPAALEDDAPLWGAVALATQALQ